MEGKPDWLPGFPVQIYCNRRDTMNRNFQNAQADLEDLIYENQSVVASER